MSEPSSRSVCRSSAASSLVRRFVVFIRSDWDRLRDLCQSEARGERTVHACASFKRMNPEGSPQWADDGYRSGRSPFRPWKGRILDNCPESVPEPQTPDPGFPQSACRSEKSRDECNDFSTRRNKLIVSRKYFAMAKRPVTVCHAALRRPAPAGCPPSRFQNPMALRTDPPWMRLASLSSRRASRRAPTPGDPPR